MYTKAVRSIFLTLCLSLLFRDGMAFRTEQEASLPDAKPATIKVLLEKNLDGALLEVRGGFKVVDPATQRKLSAGTSGKRFFVFPLQTGLRWGEEFPGTYQIRIEPTSKETTLFVNGHQFRGAMEVYLVEKKLSFVNEVDVESFLKSTLANKLQQDLPSAVRDAVAIIGRTNAYYTALSNFDSFWHVDAKKCGYNGHVYAFSDGEMNRSIDNTKHLVMTYDSQPFACTWTENSAGQTASYNVIYRRHIATPNGVLAEFARKDRNDTKWNFSIPSTDFARLVKTNRVSELDLFVDQKSKKVYGLRVKDGAHSKDINTVELMELLGKNNLKSTDFTVSVRNGRIHFTGYGKGLGVGLCLYSASQMSEAGELAPKILADFFPFTHLEKMRSYPEMIVTPNKHFFISPKKKRSLTFDDQERHNAPNSL